ncbi:hypothetical protein B0H15DRAFT_858532 [Mycena belliarum]|uniref:Uncharacterized protein n=1 Tax=Mycena belliarum TaxID=1033014 RepID=A0AAD6TZL5_9AGAR|nr:hypothetical protein B0H15DRAFT_858532 [Mycena belliae]
MPECYSTHPQVVRTVPRTQSRPQIRGPICVRGTDTAASPVACFIAAILRQQATELELKASVSAEVCGKTSATTPYAQPRPLHLCASAQSPRPQISNTLSVLRTCRSCTSRPQFDILTPAPAQPGAAHPFKFAAGRSRIAAGTSDGVRAFAPSRPYMFRARCAGSQYARPVIAPTGPAAFHAQVHIHPRVHSGPRLCGRAGGLVHGTPPPSPSPRIPCPWTRSSSSSKRK